MNYFEQFEIPVSFEVNKNLLAQQYFALQKKCHPDFFTQATEAEQAEALEASAQINKAFKVLKNEDETIKYVLQLKGLLEEDEKYQLPPAFLMQVMELNEELLSAKSQEKVIALQQDIYTPIQNTLQNYGDATSTEELLKIKDYYYKKKYLRRILDRSAD